MTAGELRDSVNNRLAEGYRLWEESGLPLPSGRERALASEALADAYAGPNAAELAAACQCFYYFRKLHGAAEEQPAGATLLGDYFFSRFSKYLIPLDSVPLTDAFADYLKNDIRQKGAAQYGRTRDTEYTAFIRGLPAVLA